MPFILFPFGSLKPGLVLPLTEVLGDKIIQTDNFSEASENYGRRKNMEAGEKKMDCSVAEDTSVPSCIDFTLWEENPDFSHNLSEVFHKQVDRKCFDWIVEQDLGLDKLFKEATEWWEDEDMGLVDLFDERLIDVERLNEYIHDKKKNKLYNIFVMEGLTPPRKRKVSTDMEYSVNKSRRRMTVDFATSPVVSVQTPDNKQRPRALTLSSPSLTTTRRKRKVHRRLVPGQQLLTGMWGKSTGLNINDMS